MNLKIVIFLLLAVTASPLFSACNKVESKEPEEVVITDGSNRSSDEVVITNADLKEDKQVSAVRQNNEPGKTILPDNSEVETIFDGFGNKTETRFFSGHPRLRFLILRTSLDGNQQVTVYGYGSGTKIVEGLGDKALTASGDEIANAAGLYATPSYSAARNFMKGDKTETTLKPLPSSAFQKPVQQPYQPVETVQPKTSSNSENPATQQNKSEDED